jgi:formate hydrogenlyase subunit 3/multisubunit Na+/H+ antiporter MnhD subunit
MSFFDTIPWMIWIVTLPLAAAILTFLFPQIAAGLSLLMGFTMSIPAIGLCLQVVRMGSQRYAIGGWGAPLGIELYANGLVAAMIALTALVALSTTIYARSYFSHTQPIQDPPERPHTDYFWPLWMFLWAALNALFLSGDIFNLYVTLELTSLSAVALVALAGGAALKAAMRYLLVSLLGSLIYLLGVVYLYAFSGTLSLSALGSRIDGSLACLTALALMAGGLIMKTALFPMHFWLPPAHASAPAPVSAALSGLVVKASFYLLLRLWFDVFMGAVTVPISDILGLMGAAAVFWGSLNALRTKRLKLLVAYSTVAQLGYLFLVFPLVGTLNDGLTAWLGCIYFILAHACAKAAAFFSAGAVQYALGHDNIDDMVGIVRCLPVPVFAFAIAGISLIGLPPSGGFIAKWLLINAALVQGQWWWVVLILAGGLFSAAYIFRVFSKTFAYKTETLDARPISLGFQYPALVLAVVALILGIVAPYPLALLQINPPLSGPVLQMVLP